MYNYNNPKIQVPPNPKGIDAAIWEIQAVLAELPWLQVVFGRANMQLGELNAKEVTDKRLKNIYYFPEVWQKGEPFNCFANDNLVGQAWFYARDPLTFPDYDAVWQDLLAVQSVSIYFWCNLEKIDPLRKFNFVEELRREVINRLTKTDFIISESYMGYLEVFDPFTITTEFRELIKPPFVAFRIDGKLNFDYNKC
jgi:hypothetical protein